MTVPPTARFQPGHSMEWAKLLLLIERLSGPDA